MVSVMGTPGKVYGIGIPRPYTKKIEGVAADALRVGRAALQYRGRIDIALFASQSFQVIPELGIGGEAVGRSGIVVRIDFSRRDIQRIVSEEVPATIYHELAHLAREQGVGTGDTLLDALVAEGIACFVEQSLCPKRRIPYLARIKNEERLWKKAAPLLLQRQYNHAEWFFGIKAIPRWAGYRLGYLIVPKFFEKQPISLPRLVRMPSKDIFAGGGHTARKR